MQSENDRRDAPTVRLRVDAHQHFWRIGRGDYGWLTQAEHPKIARDFLPDDLAPLLAKAKITKTVLVQAAPCPSRCCSTATSAWTPQSARRSVPSS
jgi:predicted TIM-barrel fold metal-dependent hydrolase